MIVQAKPGSAKWWENLLHYAVTTELWKDKNTRRFLKKLSVDAEAAYTLGAEDGKAGRPLQNIAAMMPEKPKSSIAPYAFRFAQDAYEAGYNFGKCFRAGKN